MHNITFLVNELYNMNNFEYTAQGIIINKLKHILKQSKKI